MFGGRPGLERGGSHGEGLLTGGAAVASGRADAAGEGDAETGVLQTTGAKHGVEACSEHGFVRGSEAHLLTRLIKSEPMTFDGVGEAFAGEQGFKDAIAHQESVIHRGEMYFVFFNNLIVPPDFHGQWMVWPAGFDKADFEDG